MKKQLLTGYLTISILLLSKNFYAQIDTNYLSFATAYSTMQQQNPAIQMAKQEVKQKQYENAAKKGLYMPQVSMGAKAVAMSEPLHLDLTPVRDAITPLYDAAGKYGVYSGVPNPDPNTSGQMPYLTDEMSTAIVRNKLISGKEDVMAGEWDQLIQEQNFASVTADFVWPIYAGGKIRGANAAASVELEIENEAYRQVEGELLDELVNRYYGLVLANQAVEVRRKMMISMENHQSDAQKLFDNGMIAKVELLHANVARNEAQREFKQAQRNVDIIQSALSATLSNSPNQSLVPLSQLFVNEQLPSLDVWLNQCMNANPQLKQIEGKRGLVDIKQRVMRESYMPTIAMMGTYNIVDADLSPYMPEWLVGVGLKWNIFEGMGRNNELKASNTLEQQVNFAEQKAQQDLTAYITKLYQELYMYKEQLSELESTLQLAEEYSESTQKAFNQGLATSSMVVEASTKVSQVKILRLQVFYQYDITLSKMLQMTGTPNDFIQYCTGNNTRYENL